MIPGVTGRIKVGLSHKTLLFEFILDGRSPVLNHRREPEVLTQEHNRVVVVERWAEPAEQVAQGFTISMHVADCCGCHNGCSTCLPAPPPERG